MVLQESSGFWGLPEASLCGASLVGRPTKLQREAADQMPETSELTHFFVAKICLMIGKKEWEKKSKNKVQTLSKR